jgi:hypothetical protein
MNRGGCIPNIYAVFHARIQIEDGGIDQFKRQSKFYKGFKPFVQITGNCRASADARGVMGVAFCA